MASVLDVFSRRCSLACALLVLGSCASQPKRPAVPVQGVDMIPEERVGIDDVFEVRVFAEPDLSGPYRVASDGTIDYPFAGRISVVGLL